MLLACRASVDGQMPAAAAAKHRTSGRGRTHGPTYASSSICKSVRLTMCFCLIHLFRYTTRQTKTAAIEVQRWRPFCLPSAERTRQNNSTEKHNHRVKIEQPLTTSSGAVSDDQAPSTYLINVPSINRLLLLLLSIFT